MFVGAVARDGSLSVIDIDDYDAPARAQSLNVVDGTNGYRFVRHAPRATTTAVPSAGASVAAAPVLSTLVRNTQRVQTQREPVDARHRVPARALGGRHGALRDRLRRGRGQLRHRAGAAPHAEQLAAARAARGVRRGRRRARRDGDARRAHLARAPATASAEPRAWATRALLAGDPYAVRNDAWTLTYEGVLPSLDLTNASFPEIAGDATHLRVDAPSANFCTRGALAQLPRLRSLRRMHDGVTLVGDPTPLAADAELCRREFGNAANPIARDYVITEAWQDHLVLDVLDDDRRATTYAAAFPSRRACRCGRATSGWSRARNAGYLTARCAPTPPGAARSTPRASRRSKPSGPRASSSASP